MSSPLIRASAPARAAESAQIRPAHSQTSRRVLAVMVAVAFALRIFWILSSRTYHIPAFPDDHFYFGYETGRIARAIALGYGFSNPFDGITGPTAWLAPIYPYMAAGVFKVFGIYSATSAFVLLALNAVFSALTCIPIFLIARCVFGTRVAWWSSWSWALLTPVTYWSVRWVWETSLSTLLLTCIVLVTIALADAPRLRAWLLFGLLWGLAALTNPSLLSLLPLLGAWACWQNHRQRRAWLLPASAAGLLFIALIAPWTVRNYRTFHHVVPLRDNLGVELRLGNGPGADGIWMEWLHPTQNALEFKKYRELGEVAYARHRGDQAVLFIRHNPARFAELCAKRFIYFWAGVPRTVNWKAGAGQWKNIASIVEFRNSGYLALSLLAFWGLWLAFRRGNAYAPLFAVVLLVYPLIYYITFAHPRYRHPIEPEMLMLACFLVSQTSTFRQRVALIRSRKR